MRASVAFDPHDLWVGVYWRTVRHLDDMEVQYLHPVKVVRHESLRTSIYICLVPMLPIRLDFTSRTTREHSRDLDPVVDAKVYRAGTNKSGGSQ